MCFSPTAVQIIAWNGLKESSNYHRCQPWVCQNVSKKALFTGPKIQVKMPSNSGNCVLGEGQFTVSCMLSPLWPNDEEY